MKKINDDNNNSNLFDKIDLKLLNLFLKDKNSREIAEESKIPLSTVKRRTKNMLKEGLVNHKTEINYERLGINKSFVFVNIIKKEQSDIINNLFNIKQITSVSVTLYNFDLICIALFKNNKEFYQIISSVKKIPGVKKVLIAQEMSLITSGIDSNVQYMYPSLKNE
jgi:DNA-binding Lrp family transcriptional regulator